MADIKLVIKIPKKWLDDMVKEEFEDVDELCAIIQHSTPLPEGCGRIMDVDKILKQMKEREEELKDNRSRWQTAGFEAALDMFGETIIEADEPEGEDKE